ncbi:hypothetical protein AGMMS49546_29150 [Spirochaetia bacterium]|nr:hypothetical protein AGMMS49546_29150 [Spirochaetia bacterium]
MPAYENELTGGFDIMYEIPLSDSISLLCRGDNKKLRSDQKEVEIDKPVLTDGFGSYLVVVNRGKNSITLARGNARIPTLERQGNYLTSGGQYEFSPGVKAVYRIHPDNADQFEIEDGQKRTAVILPQTRDNYLYKVEYSPQSAVLFDARPLAMIGEPIYAAVEFRGRSLSDAEKNIFIQGLQRGIQNNNALVQITPPPPEVQIFHSFVITVNTMIRPPSPPANTELIQCDVSIAFARNGTTVQQSEQKRISELGSYTDRAFSLAANFIRDNGAFFQGVNEIAAQ